MEHQRKNLIYLTGFMGSGKTTIAPILANTLGYEYVDLDAAIESQAGKKVSDIFLEYGEPYFREIEHNLLQATSHRRHCVISLGGGTIANSNNLSLITASGLLIYLKADAEQIFHRMKHKSDRPLLRTPEGERLTDDDLRKRIDALLIAREPFYSKADITIPTDEVPLGKTIDLIVKRIHTFVE